MSCSRMVITGSCSLWALLCAACSAQAPARVDAAPDAARDALAEAPPDRAPPPPPPPDAGAADRAPAGDLLPGLAAVRCGAPPPAGVQLAAPLPSYGGGSCPPLAAGTNDLVSQGNPRRFLLVLPASPQPGERFPVLFLWYWLKGKPESFLEQAELQAAADAQRFVAVIPAAKGDLKILNITDVPWPFLVDVPEARMAEEFAFFDDMLACVAQQFPVDKECVSSVGVSAGALFTVQLAAARSERLASVISLSGGLGGGVGSNAFVRGWPTPPVHRMPLIVLWGGPADSCALLNFEVASRDLERELVAGGHFFVECVHDCKHAAPPLEAPVGESLFAGLWRFALDHPYWLPAGQSPYLLGALPAGLPPWCGVGAGSAQPRQGGQCPPPGCPI